MLIQARCVLNQNCGRFSEFSSGASRSPHVRTLVLLSPLGSGLSCCPHLGAIWTPITPSLWLYPGRFLGLAILPFFLCPLSSSGLCCLLSAFPFWNVLPHSWRIAASLQSITPASPSVGIISPHYLLPLRPPFSDVKSAAGTLLPCSTLLEQETMFQSLLNFEGHLQEQQKGLATDLESGPL